MEVRNKMFNLIVLLALAFCEIGCSNKTTTQPELLWKKEFKTEINSLAISRNGEKIALIVNPESKDYKDERYYGDAGDSIRKEWFGSRLYYFDSKGKVLWEYEAEKMTMLDNVKMSDNGDYIACALVKFYTEDRKIGYSEGDKIKKYQDVSWEKFLFFNSKGKLLWSFKGAISDCRISSNGNYILLIPDGRNIDSSVGLASGEIESGLDDFYLLNKDGKILWKILWKGENFSPTCKMTKDGRRIMIDNTLYDRNKNILWRLKKGVFTEITEDGSFGIVEEYERIKSVVDLNKKKVLWKVKANIIRESSTTSRTYYILPFTEYFIDESKKYLVTLMTEELADDLAKKVRFKKGELKIYDLKTGRLLKKKLDPSMYYNYKELYENRRRKYRYRIERNVLNCYPVGSIKGIN